MYSDALGVVAAVEVWFSEPFVGAHPTTSAKAARTEAKPRLMLIDIHLYGWECALMFVALWRCGTEGSALSTGYRQL